MPEDKDAKKPISDVEEPGKSAPPETSKPVIAGNRPLLKDPMVVHDDDKKDEDADAEEPKPAAKQTLSSSSKVKLQPTEAALAAAKADEEKSKKDEADKPTIPTEAEAEIAKNEAETKDADAQPDGAKSDEADEAKPTDKPSKKAAAEAAAAEAKLKHQAAIQKLADSRQYALPIQVPQERRNRQALIIGGVIAVLLILAWLDIALDAHIINMGGLHAPTHFFSN